MDRIDFGRTGQGSCVLIVDDQEVFGANLCRSFRELGHETWLAKDDASALALASAHRPHLIVSEIKLGTCWMLDHLCSIKHRFQDCRVAVVTAYPSVASAVRAMKLGLDAYLAKPVTAAIVVAALGALGGGDAGSDPALATVWPTLDRTVWEYLNQVFSVAGSMSEAARRLGVDRRSLRRMLARYPSIR